VYIKKRRPVMTSEGEPPGDRFPKKKTGFHAFGSPRIPLPGARNRMKLLRKLVKAEETRKDVDKNSRGLLRAHLREWVEDQMNPIG